MNEAQLRFGTAARLYYDAVHEKLPGQLDLLDTWFPSLIVRERNSSGPEKADAEYIDREFFISAVKYKGSFYAGSGSRVTQITGRLTGTAKGNREKERRAASLIQKHLAGRFVTELGLLPQLQELVLKRTEVFDEEQREAFYISMLAYTEAMVDTREQQNEYDCLNELFPLDREVFEGIVYNAVYQMTKQSDQSIANGYLWLLLGGLLRNETGRLLRLYDSSFIPIRRQSSEDGTIRDKLLYLIAPEYYESVYEGDDLDARFPGIEWYCDRCGEYLNEQEGFTDAGPVWICRRCGYENRIEADRIFASREDYQNQLRPMSEEDLKRAIKERKQKKKQ